MKHERQMDLFDAGRKATKTARRRRPKDWIDKAWKRFDSRHPEVFEQLVKYVRMLMDQGYKHYGIAALFENFRWHKRIPRESDASEEFKLNNNYRALYARRLMEEHPEFEGFLEIRARRYERAKK